MTRREKELERIRNNPTNVSFEDLDKLLRSYGFEPRSHGGSHYVYDAKGCRPLVVPKRRPVKSVYVKKALAFIEECADPTDI